MLRHIGRSRERGAGTAEYAGLVVLAALILGGLVAAGIPGAIAGGVRSTICQVFQDGNCDKPQGGKPRADGQHDGSGDGRSGDGNGSGNRQVRYRSGQGDGSGGHDGGKQDKSGDEPTLADLQDQADKTQKKLDGANGKYGNIKGQIIDILGSFLGADDIKKCFGEGSISSCLWSALDIGGLFSAVLKVGKFAKAVKKSVKLWKKYNKGRKVIAKAEKAANRAKSRLRSARKACGLPANSFTAGTPVVLAGGHRRPIEEIAVGDRVRSVDPVTSLIHAEPVTALIRGHGTKHLVRLRVATDPYGLNSDTVTATGNHPFWVANRHAWVDAGNLRPNDRIGDGHGHRTRVLGRHAISRTTTAYNLTVADTHTYQIEAAGQPLLAHNAAPKKCPSKEALKKDLPSWRGRTLKFGNQSFKIEKRGMKHILKRHHPKYWDGSTKKSQTFFDKKMTIRDVENAASKVMKQNRKELTEKGGKGLYNITGKVNGKEYVLGVNNGRVAQFYPKP